MLSFDSAPIGAFLKEKLADWQPSELTYAYGTVESCADGIVRVAGLGSAKYGEILEFENDNYGIALDMRADGVSAALLTKGLDVITGSVVHGTGRVADVGVGEELLGHTVDPLGRPIDGSSFKLRQFRPVESPAPAIMDRSPVNTPLETGILAIDSMIPIGRGQRELIIGDRQTGKTSIALSAIMNQAKTGVICVYCAIGQKASSVASLVHTLEQNGTMEHSVVVASTASDSPTMQYLAPYAACAIAEYFMYQGKDALVIYDDLSKHAVAYRSMSLLLRRPSGREAYPGDIFYLHSRLLERAAKLCEAKGGGSLTALPIVETMAGDISAYIPTNVISITDGQIFLETGLFHSGVRPAINVGLSVSRVGRAAQYKAMKDVSGSMRIEIARYRELAAFSQFGADVDEATAQELRRGERIIELLKQPQSELLSLAEQCALLLAFGSGALTRVPVKDVPRYKNALLVYLEETRAAALNEINSTKKLSDTVRGSLLQRIDEFTAEFCK